MVLGSYQKLLYIFIQFLFEPRSLSSPSLGKFPLFSYLIEHLLQVLSFSTTREEGFWDRFQLLHYKNHGPFTFTRRSTEMLAALPGTERQKSQLQGDEVLQNAWQSSSVQLVWCLRKPSDGPCTNFKIWILETDLRQWNQTKQKKN